MVKKVLKKDFLTIHKKFTLVLRFKKHSIGLILTSDRGVIAWKTSRSENFIKRARVTRLTGQFLGGLMGKHMASLGIKRCNIGIRGPDYKGSFARAILYELVKQGRLKINRIDILSKVRFGGTKFPKRANRKGKGKKKKKEKKKN
jgi:hypothetical protein